MDAARSSSWAAEGEQEEIEESIPGEDVLTFGQFFCDMTTEARRASTLRCRGGARR